MTKYRYSKKRGVLLLFNLAFSLFLFANAIDDQVRGLSGAVIILCIVSLYDWAHPKKEE